MIFRHCIVSFRLALLLLAGVVEASAQNAPSAKPFERFDGCVLSADERTDGQSFHVRLPDDRLETFPQLRAVQRTDRALPSRVQ
jgi:hypothetical protein